MWYKYSKTIIAGRADDLVRSFLKNDLTKVQDIKNIDVDEKLKSKIYPVLAFFYSRGTTLNALQYCAKNLNDVIMKYPHTLDVSTQGVKIRIHREEEQLFDEFLKFSEYIDGIHSNMPGEKPQQTSDVGFESGKIHIAKIYNTADAFRYGNDQTWCISEWKSGMWQSYRDSQASTFYFVFDGTRPENDPLRKVAVDVNEDGVELTDRNNKTGTIAQFGKNWEEYFEYLESKGVDTSQFVNDPLTAQEREEAKIVGGRTDDLNKFKNWNANYKSKYIGRGHTLSNEQLSYILGLYQNKLNPQLAEQYVNTGIPLPEEQIEILKNYKDLFSSYIRKMGILIDMYKDKSQGLKNIPNTLNKHFFGIMEQKGINYLGKWDSFYPKDTVELVQHGAAWSPEMWKNYKNDWVMRLTPGSIQQLQINPNELLGRWDLYDPLKTIELINIGAKITPENLKRRHQDTWVNHLNIDLIKQMNLDPNDFLGVWDRVNPLKTIELINIGAKLTPESLKRYTSDWVRLSDTYLIKQMNVDPTDLLGVWDRFDPLRTIELINMGAKWNPEKSQEYGGLWQDKLTSNPELMKKLQIDPTTLLGVWDRDYPSVTIKLINLGAKWNPEMWEKYNSKWVSLLEPDQANILGIDINHLKIQEMQELERMYEQDRNYDYDDDY